MNSYISRGIESYSRLGSIKNNINFKVVECCFSLLLLSHIDFFTLLVHSFIIWNYNLLREFSYHYKTFITFGNPDLLKINVWYSYLCTLARGLVLICLIYLLCSNCVNSHKKRKKSLSGRHLHKVSLYWFMTQCTYQWFRVVL